MHARRLYDVDQLVGVVGVIRGGHPLLYYSKLTANRRKHLQSNPAGAIVGTVFGVMIRFTRVRSQVRVLYRP